MDTVRKGLRNGDLQKDNYGRVACSTCDETLKKRSDPGEVGSVRVCPDCEAEWRELR